MQISIIAAIAYNGVIGNKGKLPWHLPLDLKRFKRLTRGHPVIMGRKTHLSIGKPLPGRLNIVLSHQPRFKSDGVEVADSLSAALAIAGQAEAREVFVIGGSAVFREAIPLASKMYLTRVLREVRGDTYFPLTLRWEEDVSAYHRFPKIMAGHTHPFAFHTYYRIAPQ